MCLTNYQFFSGISSYLNFFQESVEISLFELLDWCATYTPASTVTAYIGIELLPSTYDMSPSRVSNRKSRDHIGSRQDGNDRKSSLLQVTEDALLDLSRMIVRLNADKYVTQWILFCRAVALGLRSSTGQSSQTRASNPGTAGGADDRGDELGDTEDGFVIIAETNTSPIKTPVSKNGDKGERSGAAVVAAAPVSYQQYAIWCRDQAVSKVQGLPVIVRIRVKCVAIKCASESLSELLLLQGRRKDVEEGSGRSTFESGESMKESLEQNKAKREGDSGDSNSNKCGMRFGQESISVSPFHSDLGQARTTTQLALSHNSCVGDLESFLSGIPCYLSLFMPDLVNAACACATFTVEDGRVVGLQRVSLQLLSGILNLFKHTLDPDSDPMISLSSTKSQFKNNDDNRSQENRNNVTKVKILSLYITQFISAIRPCLNVPGAPDLLRESGDLIIMLIKENLLTDKVILKRLLKALSFSFSQQEGKTVGNDLDDNNSNSSYSTVRSVRATVSPDLDEDICVLDHIIRAHTAAQLYLLANTETANNSVKHIRNLDRNGHCNSSSMGRDSDSNREAESEISTEIRRCLVDTINVQMPYLQAVWMALSIDTARLLQCDGEPGLGLNADGSLQAHEREEDDGGKAVSTSKLSKSGDTYDRYAPPTATEGREPVAPTTKRGTGVGAGQGPGIVQSLGFESSSGDSFSCPSQEGVESEEGSLSGVRVETKGLGRIDDSTQDNVTHTKNNDQYVLNLQSDPRRGGLIYSAAVSPLILVQTLDRFLPSVLSAVALALFNNVTVGKIMNSIINCENDNSKDDKSDNISHNNKSKNETEILRKSEFESNKVENEDIRILYAISLTALTHHYKKIKLRKKLKIIDDDMEHHTASILQLYVTLTFLSNLTFVPLSQERNNVPSIEMKKNEDSSKIMKKKNESIEEVKSVSPALPTHQWYRLVSFTIQNILLFNESLFFLPKIPSSVVLHDQKKLLFSESFSQSVFVKFVNIIYNLTNGLVNNSVKLSKINANNIEDKLTMNNNDREDNEKEDTERETERETENERERDRETERETEKKQQADAEKLKILIFSFSVFSIFSIFPILHIPSPGEETSSNVFKELLTGKLPQMRSPSFPPQSQIENLANTVACLEGDVLISRSK